MRGEGTLWRSKYKPPSPGLEVWRGEQGHVHIGQHHAEAQTMRDIDSVLGEGRDGMPWDPANQGAASELGVGDINGTL